jgi:PAS domain S-box-containing protein
MGVKEQKLEFLSINNLIKENEELKKQIKNIKRGQKNVERRIEYENKKKYYSLFNKIADPVFIFDATTYKFLDCNESVLKKYGYTRDEILTMTPFDLHKPEEFDKVRESIENRSDDDSNILIQLTKDRRQRIVKLITEETYYEGNPAWITIVHDITEQKMFEEELQKYKSQLEEIVDEKTIEVLITNRKLENEIQERKKAEQIISESEIKFRNIIEKSLDGIMLIDESGSVIEWNKGQENIYGSERAMIVGKKIWDVQFQHEPKVTRVPKTAKKITTLWKNFFKTGNNPFENNLQVSLIERSNGELRDIQQLYFPIETDTGLMMACTTRDITAKLAMERQLFQSQKMEAIGTLAGGIAHDFNNILGAIMGFTELAIRKSETDSPLRKYLNQINTASKRATELVKQILTFSRRDKREKEPVQMSTIMKEAFKLLRSLLPSNMEFNSNIQAPNAFVLADPTQMHQVVMNLCTNAEHAMRGRIKRKLEVTLKETTIKPGQYKELKPGPYLLLSVSDTGYGIKPELIDKIYDPFFTTKKVGEGTGMGLAVVHGIVKSHNGHIYVESEVGKGTTFSVLLPKIIDVILKKEDQMEIIQGGNERILLVEQDPALIEAEKELLEELGYIIEATINSADAYKMFESKPNKYDLIITDFTMPNLTGLQLIKKIRAKDSKIPVILCTGLNEIVSKEEANELKIGDFINKPIDLINLAKIIRKLIEKNKSA